MTAAANPQSPDSNSPRASSGPQQVLVATTAMLAFISFWRAAAIVLNDMGSSAFYAGAIAEHFVGKTAPWFVLSIMVLSYAVRAVYIESCSMSSAAASIASSRKRWAARWPSSRSPP